MLRQGVCKAAEAATCKAECQNILGVLGQKKEAAAAASRLR